MDVLPKRHPELIFKEAEKEVGRFTLEDGVLRFEGMVDESARIMTELVVRLFNGLLEKADALYRELNKCQFNEHYRCETCRQVSDLGHAGNCCVAKALREYAAARGVRLETSEVMR